LLQLLPAGLGLLSVLVAINAQQSAQALVDSYRGHGISAYPAIGLTFLMFGAVLCAIGGIGSTVMAWRPDGGDGSGQGEDERIERNEPGKRGGPDEVEPPPVPHPSPSGRLCHRQRRRSLGRYRRRRGSLSLDGRGDAVASRRAGRCGAYRQVVAPLCLAELSNERPRHRWHQLASASP